MCLEDWTFIRCGEVNKSPYVASHGVSFPDCRHKITEMRDHRNGMAAGKPTGDLVMLLLSGISLSVLIVGFVLGYGTRASISHSPSTNNARRRAF